MLQTVTKYPNGNILRTSFKYDFLGNIVTKEEIAGSVSKLTTYTYDNRGKLISESTKLNGSTAATVNYTYDDMERIAKRTYGNGVTETLKYNIQGWTTTQEAKKGSSNIYSQTLSYYSTSKGTTPLYSGNISEWATQQAANTQQTYGLSYDKQGRLISSSLYSGTSTTAQTSYTERGITYDKNGNINSLQRYASALQDNYSYNYSGNKITSITGTDNGTAIASATYSYDSNGNATTDGLKNLQISYNILNLPQKVSQSGTTKATYTWFADGSKYTALDNAGNGYCYIGSLIYNTSTNTAATLESTDFSQGRIALNNNTQTIHYHHKDHLGSVRAITNGGGTVIEQNAYYPFGGRHTFGQSYAQTTTNRYKFNGKEEQTIGNLDLLDYGARMYDAKIARWLVQDPLAEKYYSFSAYNYCVNNPVMFVDPYGKDWYSYEQIILDEDNHQFTAVTMYAWTTATSQEELDAAGIEGTYAGEAVVVFNGSINEKLGENSSIFGKGAILADVTVYGPKGENDIEYYQGYTMTSDPTRWGVIADGEYIVNYDYCGKSGNLKSHWAINGRNKVPAKDGINPSPYRDYDDALVGTFIHSTRDNGFMGNFFSTKRNNIAGISEGCLIIAPSIYSPEGKLIKRGWDQYNNQLKGVNKHLLILTRH